MFYVMRALALLCVLFFLASVSHAASVKNKSLVVSTPVRCLAANIYHEARGETVAGQLAVAMVTLNRAERQQKQVCKVVFKPKQFSWTNKLVQKVKSGWKLSPKLAPVDKEAWKVATKVALKALSGKIADATQGSKFYHTQDIHPKWDRNMKLTKVIGHHEFFVQLASN
jgi:spore germination cell wall hydrolase CwlJ-like protein